MHAHRQAGACRQAGHGRAGQVGQAGHAGQARSNMCWGCFGLCNKLFGACWDLTCAGTAECSACFVCVHVCFAFSVAHFSFVVEIVSGAVSFHIMARGSFTPPKRGLFALSKDEIERPSKKVKFSQTLPSVPKGAEVDEEDMGMLRDAFVDLIDKLWRKPMYIQKAVHWLDNKVKSDALKGDDDNFTSVSVLGKLDESWTCAWLVANSGISLAGLETVCLKDPDTYKHLLIFALKCSLTVKMPQSCKVKSVCSSSLKSRHEGCGNRLLQVTDELLVERTNKCANWGAIGVYEPRFVTGNPNCVEMLHRPTKHVAKVPEYVVITKEFSIKCNWDDMEAYACIGKHCKPLCELFDESFGPYNIKQWSGTEKKMRHCAAGGLPSTVLLCRTWQIRQMHI